MGQHKGALGCREAGGEAYLRAEDPQDEGRSDLVAEKGVLSKGDRRRGAPPQAQIAPQGIEEHPQDPQGPDRRQIGAGENHAEMPRDRLRPLRRRRFVTLPISGSRIPPEERLPLRLALPVKLRFFNKKKAKTCVLTPIDKPRVGEPITLSLVEKHMMQRE